MRETLVAGVALAYARASGSRCYQRPGLNECVRSPTVREGNSPQALLIRKLARRIMLMRETLVAGVALAYARASDPVVTAPGTDLITTSAHSLLIIRIACV